ncbi:unnamed protein product [Citrullus colocynthis]|uniref:Uncharacterized protein n=1 Tax=Citrullus colocynthis TaxID=252529 RepID=A0ABP0YKL8_9ROSI
MLLLSRTYLRIVRDCSLLNLAKRLAMDDSCLLSVEMRCINHSFKNLNGDLSNFFILPSFFLQESRILLPHPPSKFIGKGVY